MTHSWRERNTRTETVLRCRACGLVQRYVRVEDGVIRYVGGVVHEYGDPMPACGGVTLALVPRACQREDCERDAAPGRRLCAEHLSEQPVERPADPPRQCVHQPCSQLAEPGRVRCAHHLAVVRASTARWQARRRAMREAAE